MLSARCVRRLVCSLSVAACSSPGADGGSSSLLYVWSGDVDMKDSDFLTVVDADPRSKRYAQVLSTMPVGASHTHPHHLEYQMPPRGPLWASGYLGEKIFLFDVSSPRSPRLARTLTPPPGLRYPHDFARLPNGHVLVSFLGTDTMPPGGNTGLAEYTPEGELIRSVKSQVPTVEAPIRTYAMAMLPARDRLVTTSATMFQDTSADVVQIWKLSTLELLTTMQVPPGPYPGVNALPFEPRVVENGASILFNAYGCGFYHLTGIETPTPTLTLISTFAEEFASCGVPVLAGNYWVMTVGKLSRLVTLDVSDPAHPREVSRLSADTTFHPHWLAKDPRTDRLIVGGENGGEERMLMARLDARTGALSWDETFRAADGKLGLSMVRAEWPHGKTSAAFAHAALFGR